MFNLRRGVGWAFPYIGPIFMVLEPFWGIWPIPRKGSKTMKFGPYTGNVHPTTLFLGKTSFYLNNNNIHFHHNFFL